MTARWSYNPKDDPSPWRRGMPVCRQRRRGRLHHIMVVGLMRDCASVAAWVYPARDIAGFPVLPGPRPRPEPAGRGPGRPWSPSHGLTEALSTVRGWLSPRWFLSALACRTPHLARRHVDQIDSDSADNGGVIGHDETPARFHTHRAARCHRDHRYSRSHPFPCFREGAGESSPDLVSPTAGSWGPHSCPTLRTTMRSSLACRLEPPRRRQLLALGALADCAGRSAH